jgi:hypothetical protein
MRFGIILSALLISSAANAETALKCNGGEVCFEKQLSGTRHDFTITPGSDIDIEVTVLNGATVTFKSEGIYNQISEVQLAPEPVTKVVALKRVPVGKSGNFTIEVQPAQVSFEGEVTITSEDY